MSPSLERRRPVPKLGERQRMVLRAVVTAYLAEAAPISSATVSHLLPVALSSASIRNTMAELAAFGLIEKPHASAGRVPTEDGLRLFVEQLLNPQELADFDQRSLSSACKDLRYSPGTPCSSPGSAPVSCISVAYAPPALSSFIKGS